MRAAGGSGEGLGNFSGRLMDVPMALSLAMSLLADNAAFSF